MQLPTGSSWWWFLHDSFKCSKHKRLEPQCHLDIGLSRLHHAAADTANYTSIDPGPGRQPPHRRGPNKGTHRQEDQGGKPPRAAPPRQGRGRTRRPRPQPRRGRHQATRPREEERRGRGAEQTRTLNPSAASTGRESRVAGPGPVGSSRSSP